MISKVLFGRECYAGWGYNVKTGYFISNSEMNRESDCKQPEVNSSTCDYSSEYQKCHGKLVEKLLGNCRDFIDEVSVENQNAYNLIEFLMENCGTNGFISHVTNEMQESVISSPHDYVYKFSCGLQQLPGKLPYFCLGNDKERFEILTDQIFEIHWIKKSLENKIKMLSLNQLSNCLPQAKNCYGKLLPELKIITNVWNQKMRQCTDLLAGKSMAIYDLWSTFPLEEILEMKKQMESTDDSFVKI
uniref:Uncharacterized protein n=1 Tax=Panagrolaimus sp. JU765 TaxID=591449 RepID=A0AC34Q3X1_9BILA